MSQHHVDDAGGQELQDAVLPLLKDDVALIAETLDSSMTYSFSNDISGRMAAVGLSSSQLARRCGATHTAVDKWCKGSAKPNSREKVKLLGMALELDERELNTLLLRNCYPGLYIKNPLDCVAKMLLRQQGGRANNTALYEEILSRLSLRHRGASAARVGAKTAPMSEEFRDAVEAGGMERWFEVHKEDFCANEGTVRAPSEMAEYLRLYLGEATVFELVETGRLSASLKGMLYELRSGRAMSVRGLRDKLIALGMCLNMTEEELDVLLSYVKFRPLTQTEMRVDLALLMALRLAHERYPGYELVNVENLRSRANDLASERLRTYVRARVAQRLPQIRTMMDYYESHAQDCDRAFERAYTGWAGRNLSDYVNDVLSSLVAAGQLSKAEIVPTLRNLGTGGGKEDAQ